MKHNFKWKTEHVWCISKDYHYRISEVKEDEESISHQGT